jgi:DNA replication ATP-dependent helicase Dna2
VKNVSAKRGGLDSSLFRLLTDAYPCATVDLGYQYRMNEDIMSLSNKLIYSGRLKCGSEKVRDQELVLPREKRGGKCGCWLDRLLEPR